MACLTVAALCGMERCSRTSTCQRCCVAASRTRRARWRRSIDAVLARLQLSPSMLRPSATSALRPGLREGQLKRSAGPRGGRRAPAQCAEPRTAHRGTESVSRSYERLLAAAPTSTSKARTYAVGGIVGDPAARIVMTDLCGVGPLIRTRARRRLARCTTCRSARVQTRAKYKIAPSRQKSRLGGGGA